MSNIIDSIRLSGVTYTLSAETSGGNNVVELTQAQYDALVTGGTVDPTALYIITDAQGGDLSNYYTKTEVDTALSGKIATSAITTAITISSTDSQVPSAKSVYNRLGDMKIVKLTESQYSALAIKDYNTLYVVIPDPSN